MKLDLNGRQLQIIGDVHLGKRFITGVPLDRRGEREEMVWAQFERELRDTDDIEMVIQVGDIFDKFTVSATTELRAAELIRGAAAARYDIPFAFIRGNHDASRDADKKSSFDVLAALLWDVPNVHFVVYEAEVIGGILFVPWHPFRTSVEMVEGEMGHRPGEAFDAVVGHWDVEGGGDNVVPWVALHEITDTVITGHDHVARTVHHPHGVTLHVVGSMQPYSFGEDPEERLYVTRPLEVVEKARAMDATTYFRSCLRVVTAPGEVMPTDIDCLQLVQKRVDAEGNSEDIEVTFDPFDMGKIMAEALADAGVTDVFAGIVVQQFEETRNA